MMVRGRQPDRAKAFAPPAGALTPLYGFQPPIGTPCSLEVHHRRGLPCRPWRLAVCPAPSRPRLPIPHPCDVRRAAPRRRELPDDSGQSSALTGPRLVGRVPRGWRWSEAAPL